MFNFYQDLSDPEKSVFRWHMRRLILLVSVLVLALAVSYGVDIWKEIKGLRGEAKLQITVAGEGKVSAKPDVARINATILTENASLKDAQFENSQKSAAVVEYLKSKGVEEKDIRTTGYHISPQYTYPPPCYPYPCPQVEDRRPKIVGYQIRNSYEITVRDIGKAGDILSGIVSAGANEVGGIVFTIDDPEGLKAEARKEAIDKAREKAKKLAKDLGRRLGKITNFSESGGFPPPIYFERQAALGKGGDLGGEAPAVEPGENEIVATVSITYEFK